MIDNNVKIILRIVKYLSNHIRTVLANILLLTGAMRKFAHTREETIIVC